jgi:serine protease Do
MLHRLSSVAVVLVALLASYVTEVHALGAEETGSLEAREEAALKIAADGVAPSVVQIRTIGGNESVDGTVLADGPTTGLIISADGYILSSAFNFAQQPSSILVTFANGKQAPAELVATDHSRMLVLLKANGVSELRVPKMAPVAEIHPGEWAVAVGRTFRADRTNVTVGIVSALNRMFGKVIQTDADVSLANYGGPLVDIRGRVLGIIVPMAPQTTSEVAGAEWYDSGIGFAVPLDGLSDRIERMKKGQDQRPGLLGINMAQKNSHSSPAELAAVRPDSPAGQAGLKKGDRIVELNGKPIKTQADLRFALGTAYGGDSVRLVAKRGTERLERTITLVGEMPPYRTAFLGILPIRPAKESAHADSDQPKDLASTTKPARTSDAPRDDEPAPAAAKNDAKKKSSDAAKPGDHGVAVRMVYAGSPAAEGGVLRGDRITQINDTKIESLDDCLNAMNNVTAGNKILVKLIRAGKPLDLTLTTARLPTNVPNELPPAYETPATTADQHKTEEKHGEARDLKLPEFPNKCRIYVPASHEADRPQAAILWIQSPSDGKPDEVIRQWQSICDRDGVLLVVPTPTANEHWERPDAEYLRRLSERMVAQYKVDPHRIVVFGQGSGGTLAWQLGLLSRDLFRGVATSGAPLPRPFRVPANEPSLRFAVFTALPANKEAAAPIMIGLRKFTEVGYNVVTITSSNATGQFSDNEREELARWIDTLDRF